MRKWLLNLWVLMGIGVVSGFSQQFYLANIRHLGIAEGLSHHQVNCFLEDEQGMWIGTGVGLDFFDGYRFKHWSKVKHGLSRNPIHHLLKDTDGVLWIFSNEKVSQKNGVISIDLFSVAEDRVTSFETYFGNSAPFKPEELQNFFADANQQLYFYANEQLWKYTNRAFKKVSLPERFVPSTLLPSGEIAGLHDQRFAWVDHEGVLQHSALQLKKKSRVEALGDTANFWLFQWQGSTFQQLSTPHITTQQVSAKLAGLRTWAWEERRQLFYLFQDQHLEIYDSQGLIQYRHPMKNRPRAIWVDRFGTLWAGTSLGIELLRLESKKFKRYLCKDINLHPLGELYRCRGILELNGQIIVNTYMGRVRIDPNTDQITIMDSIYQPKDQNNPFVAIKDKDEATIWSLEHCLIQWDSNFEQELGRSEDNENHNRGWALYEDPTGRIWGGLVEGLCYFDNGQLYPFKAYNGYDALASSHILEIKENSEKEIWLCTNSGLYVLDPKQGIIRRYWKGGNNTNYLPAEDIQHWYEDKEGVYWIASADEGLIRWDTRSGDTQIFSREEGFPTNNIYAVYEDAYHHLWLSSNYGLIRFNKADHTFQVFFEEDGISCNEFNRISHYQAEDGRLYFGGQNGVTVVNPNDFLEKPEDLAIAQLSLGDAQFMASDGAALLASSTGNSSGNTICLPSDVRFAHFGIHYPDLFWTDQFELAYQLVDATTSLVPPFRKNNYVSPDNIVRLIGIQPGQYFLNIKAQHINGRPLSAPLKISIGIDYPFYQKSWFRLLAFGFLLLSVVGITRWRTAQLKKRQLELERLVEQRSRQILEDRQLIKAQAQQIQFMKDQQSDKDQRWLNKLEHTIQIKLGDINLDLSEIISDMQTSRSAFYGKVKELTNMTPNQFLLEARLQKARHLLEHQKCGTVKEVSLTVGIKKPSYFSKLYKERFQKLPSSYF